MGYLSQGPLTFRPEPVAGPRRSIGTTDSAWSFASSVEVATPAVKLLWTGFMATTSRRKKSSAQRSALVSGASSGIGQAFAERLARDGWDLCIVARRRSRLEKLARRLRRECGVAVEVVGADLTDSDALRGLEQRIEGDPHLQLLVNNAASACFGPFAEADREVADKQIQLDVVAIMRLTHAALRPMIERGRGSIINVSSVAALTPGPQYAVYSAGKCFVNGFTEALHFELEGTGIRLQALCPGLTRTEIFEKAGADTSALPDFVWMTPDDVVDASLADLDRGKLICVPGAGYQALVGLGAWLPQEAAGRLANYLNQRAISQLPDAAPQPTTRLARAKPKRSRSR